MALSGIEIFKQTPKTNCKDCGCPTCMAFAMKVAQGALKIEQCPHMSEEVLAKMAEASAPPMKTITVGAGTHEYKLGGETVLDRHEKTFVSKNLFAVSVCNANDDAVNDEAFADIAKIDYERISERMIVEFVFVNYVQGHDEAKYLSLVEKAVAADRAVVISCADPAVAEKALEISKAVKPILLGANAANYEAMNALATKFEVVLGVQGETIEETYETILKIEALGNKKLIVDVGCNSIKDVFANTVKVRRAAVKDQDRSFGYPSIVNLARLAPGNLELQAALASVFTLRYGSVIVMSGMKYAQALALYGLRQNIYTDPQKPMKVTPGIYPINGADANSPCALTVDFALSYFVISGELERSGAPVNLIIPDAAGMSVLTAWAAGKFSAGTISKFFEEFGIEDKIASRQLIIPGKVAILKGEMEDKLPNWEIIVGPPEAMQAVKFFKEF